MLRGFYFLEKLANALVAIQNYFVQKLLFLGWKSEEVSSIRLGTSYGGWHIPEFVLSMSKKPAVISCGLGDDISFDLEMAQRGFPILGVEVDNHSIAYLEKTYEIPSTMRMINARVGNSTPDSINLYSLAEQAEKIFSCDVFILKMDIEGAEIEVLPNLFDLYQRFPIVIFELDFLSLVPFTHLGVRISRIRISKELLRILRGLGYRPYALENWNIHLVRM